MINISKHVQTLGEGQGEREEGGKKDTAIGRNKKGLIERKRKRNLIRFPQANTTCMQRSSRTTFYTL